MISAALSSESPTERVAAARLIVAELSEGGRQQAKCVCGTGAWCPATEPHGYRTNWQVELDVDKLRALWLEIAPPVSCPSCNNLVGFNGEAVFVEEPA